MNVSKRTIMLTAVGAMSVGGLLVASTIWSAQRFDADDAVPGTRTVETRTSHRSDATVDVDGALPGDLCDATAVEVVTAYLSGDRNRMRALFSSDAEGVDAEPGPRSASVRSAWLASAGSDTASCLVVTDDAAWAVGFMAGNDGWKADSIIAYSGTVSMPSGAKR